MHLVHLHSISAVGTWADFTHLQWPRLLLLGYLEKDHGWKWQIKRKRCWATFLVLRGQAFCDPWPAPRQPRILWRGLWSRSFPPPRLFLDCAVQSAAYNDWEENEKSFWPQKKKKKKNLGNEKFSQNPYFISLKGFVEAGLRGRRRHMWASPLTLCLRRFFDVPPLAAFAETNLQSSLSSLLPLDPASHASAALPSPNKPLMRPNLLPPLSFSFLFLSFHTQRHTISRTHKLPTVQSSHLTLWRLCHSSFPPLEKRGGGTDRRRKWHR